MGPRSRGHRHLLGQDGIGPAPAHPTAATPPAGSRSRPHPHLRPGPPGRHRCAARPGAAAAQLQCRLPGRARARPAAPRASGPPPRARAHSRPARRSVCRPRSANKPSARPANPPICSTAPAASPAEPSDDERQRQCQVSTFGAPPTSTPSSPRPRPHRRLAPPSRFPRCARSPSVQLPQRKTRIGKVESKNSRSGWRS